MFEWIVSAVLVGGTPAVDSAPAATPPSAPAPSAPNSTPPVFSPPAPPAPPAPAPSAPSAPAATPPPAPAPATTPPPAPAPATTPPPAPRATTPFDSPEVPLATAPVSTVGTRVWVFIDRYKEAGGTIEAEDDTTIVIREPDGRVSSFAKGRLILIVRLVEPTKGGQEGIIHLRDGSDLRATIHADGFDAVEYELSGIRNKMPREAVSGVTLEASFDEKYKRFKESIKPAEIDKRLTFARWLMGERRFDLASEELRALTKEVDVPEGRDLLKQVEAQLALDAASRARRGANGSESGTATNQGRSPAPSQSPRRTGPVDLKDILPSRLLSADDVNIIRVYEVDLKKPPRMDIAPDVIRDLITNYGSSALVPTGTDERNRMFTWEPAKILKLMYDLKARDLYPRVRVTSEPWTLNLFRTRVHDAWLIPNCATSACHGGIDAGRFFLHRRGSKEERVRYTNLLILTRSKLDHPLVDFDDPDSSLIIQYALPRDEARTPHPEVKGWKPIFTGSAKALRGETLQWIRSMYKPRPDYPVDYEPPHLDAIDRTHDADEPAER